MRREIAGVRPALGMTAAALAALVVGLAGCGAGSGGGSSSARSSPAGSASQASSRGSSGSTSLATSRLRILTKLKRVRLCGVLSPAQAGKILGAATAAPAYTNRLGLGTTCEWIKRRAAALSRDELYLGISPIVDWTGARAADKLLHTSSVTIDGHPALVASKQTHLTWVQVDVALGGDHDPVAEYRAPTMAIALALAKAATPGLVAMG